MIRAVQVILTVALFAIALSQRQERGFSAPEYYHATPLNQVPILRMEQHIDGQGAYNYAYETGNQIASQAQGEPGRMQGSYSYTGPDGKQYSMQYTADENGFHPSADHLPVAPPMPELIKRALEQNLADEARGVFDDGQYREQASAASNDVPSVLLG